MKALLGTFTFPDARFAHIHSDFISPLPPSEGHQYYITIIDKIYPLDEINTKFGYNNSYYSQSSIEWWDFPF